MIVVIIVAYFQAIWTANKKSWTLYLNENWTFYFANLFSVYSFLQILKAERQTETEKMKLAMASLLLVLLSLLIHSNAKEEAFNVRHHLSTMSRIFFHKIKFPINLIRNLLHFLIIIFNCVLRSIDMSLLDCWFLLLSRLLGYE